MKNGIFCAVNVSKVRGTGKLFFCYRGAVIKLAKVL